jgi:hypothetical protein
MEHGFIDGYGNQWTDGMVDTYNNERDPDIRSDYFWRMVHHLQHMRETGKWDNND